MNPQPPSTMKSESQKTAGKSNQDMKTFEQLPDKTKELELLLDQAEKSTGPEGVRLNKVIQDKAR